VEDNGLIIRYALHCVSVPMRHVSLIDAKLCRIAEEHQNVSLTPKFRLTKGMLPPGRTPNQFGLHLAASEMHKCAVQKCVHTRCCVPVTRASSNFRVASETRARRRARALFRIQSFSNSAPWNSIVKKSRQGRPQASSIILLRESNIHHRPPPSYALDLPRLCPSTH